MKTLEKFAKDNNLFVHKIKYRHQFGYCKRVGYDLTDKNRRIIASFEPVNFSNGDKWFLRHGYSFGNDWSKRITKKVLNDLDLSYNSYVYLKN